MTSLDEYATTHASRRGSPCSVCELPPKVLEQVNEHIRRRTVRRIIAEWLVTEGFDKMTANRLNNHTEHGHVEGY